MEALVSNLVQSGRPRDVVRILEEGVLTEAGDPELVKAVVVAQARDQDYNRAIQYLDRLKKSVFETQGRSASGLEPFRAQLYKDWLRDILDKGGYFSAQVAYEEAARAFPDDPEIRLLGVEVALAENNLARAQELFRQKEILPLLKARADHLASRLKTAEEDEALVIPIKPGENRIYLEAKLNGTYLQRFLVDTGATLSSIPSEALDPLRIVIDLRKGVAPKVILNQLFAHTQLQIAFGVINLALVNGMPKVLTLKQMVEYFIAHRKDLVTRRTRFDLVDAAWGVDRRKS